MSGAELVSTIIPVHNRPQQLREAVESVLAQDWRPIEVIIVDDGSTDAATPAMAQALAQAHPAEVRAMTQANAGPGAAREAGRAVARGAFIQYLDSDDVLLPGKFSAQAAALRERPDCDVAYGMTRLRHADGSIAPGAWKDSGLQRDAMFPSFLVQRWWDTPTPLYRRAIIDRAGPWTDLWLEEDWEYDCRIASLGARLVWCDRFVCEVRDHADSRLGRGDALDARRLRQRARSHALIFSHAQAAGIGPQAPEMRHFARALFLLARQCGCAGLALESRRLFDLARRAAGEHAAAGLDFQLYGLLARTLGWTAAGKAGIWLDRLRG